MGPWRLVNMVSQVVPGPRSAIRVVCGRGRNPTLRSSTCSAGVEVAALRSGGEDLLATCSRNWPLRPDVSVERHRPDTKLAAQFRHGGVAVGIAAWASRTWAFDSANFLPPLQPRALAALSPARVRLHRGM